MQQYQDAASSALLELLELRVNAGLRTLVDRFNLKLSHGECLGLTGPSGAGKTTLLRTIAGLINPASGEIRLASQTPADLGYPSYRRQVVYVAEHANFLESTVQRDFARAFSYHTATQAFDPEEAVHTLELLGLDSSTFHQTTHTLSSGEQKRVSIARALLLKPQVLLLDEPTSVLDAGSTAKVEHTISQILDAQGSAAIVISHDADQVQRWCHRQVSLKERAP